MKYKSKILPSIILSMVLSSVIISCSKKYDKSKTEISNFKISDYEFTVYHRITKERESGIIVKDYYDTVLVNICDFYEDFAECDGDEGYIRK